MKKSIEKKQTANIRKRSWQQLCCGLMLVCMLCLSLASCTDAEEKLRQRAAELCAYIPDHRLLEQSKDYLTADFYAVLDTMFNHLPEHEAMDHEWLYYFVTGNGGTIADFEVVGVELLDEAHAVATISVRQRWEDGSFDPENDIEEHRLYMERVDGQWLMSDFDDHKQDCINYIANNRKEQALRDALTDYLVREVGSHYLQGELCVPSLSLVHVEELDSAQARVWGDFWVFWYDLSGDTLKTVSGGNHSGCMTVSLQGKQPVVTAFDQTLDGAAYEPSAKRIFGPHYDIFQNIHSNEEVREAVRCRQLQEYVLRHHLNARYYQDYGWEARSLQED